LNSPAKIVLVEDEAFQRQVIAECLAQHGLRPTTFASGAELKQLAQHAMPDVALLDVHLNEAEDGFALARWLRSRSARVGILMLTAAGDTTGSWGWSRARTTMSRSRSNRGNSSRA
jgi:DNA-binding response OmpR family regulator